MTSGYDITKLESMDLDKEITDQDLPDKRTKKFMGLTVPQQQKFDDKAAVRYLAYYAMTGRKADSAKAAGVNYGCVRHWEVNSDHFGQLCLEAHQEYLNKIEREIWRRGVEGVLEPIVAGKDPEIVTYVRKYSDKMLELLARKADPTGFGTKDTNLQVNVNTGVLAAPTKVNEEGTILTIEEVSEEDDAKSTR